MIQVARSLPEFLSLNRNRGGTQPQKRCNC